MKKTALIIFIFLPLLVQAQELLPNNSFEDENICTEYIKNCAPEAWVSTDIINLSYFEGSRYAADGRYFIGILLNDLGKKIQRSFFRTRLLCGLQKGSSYRITAMVRSAHEAFDSIGVYFSSSDFLYEKRNFRTLAPAAVFRDTGDIVKADPLKWQKISFDYTANGEEIFLALGNFKRDLVLDARPDMSSFYYLFLDRITMLPLDKHELICQTADSIRTILYNDNDRHNNIEKRKAIYKNKAPVIIVPPATAIQHIDTLVIPDILFATGSSKLNAGSFLILDSFSERIRTAPADSLVVEGHTDSVGTIMYNKQLSAARAKAVADYIQRKSVLSLRKIIVRHHAFMLPVASNKTQEGRQKNRRVEIYLYRTFQKRMYQ